MGYIYAIGDLHGKYELLLEALTHIDLEDTGNKLYFLGDYIDRGDKSLETITFVKQLWESKPLQVFPIMGNHEVMLLEDLESDIFSEDGHDRLISLLPEGERGVIDFSKGNLIQKYRKLQQLFREKQGELIAWVENLPLYQETKGQIFVHAGITEEENWKVVTDPHTFLWSRKYSTGYFEKDIIMGHTPTSMIVNDLSFHKILWDGASHYYVDGHAFRVNQLQILRYDTEREVYECFDHDLGIYSVLEPYEGFGIGILST